MRTKHMDRKLRILMPFVFVPLLFWGCTTDLEETTFSVTTPENYYQTEEELLAAVIPVYGNLRTYSWGEYTHVQDHSSDALYAPTRGGDWFDNGNWQRLQEHTWTETDDKLNIAWNDAFRGVALANSTLSALNESTSGSDKIPTFKAETRFLRAFYYWWLVDMFGGVPIVTDAVTAALYDYITETATTDNIEPVDASKGPGQNTRTEVYNFIVAETIAALADLEASPADYGRVSKGAANALLATVYLNAGVYTGTTKWSECIAACDAVINSGLYELMPTVVDVFALENEGAANTENIFVVAHKPESGVGIVRQMGTLHYSQLPSSPWNGFAVLADYYNSYDSLDERRAQLLVGQQYILGGDAIGDSAFQRDDVPLVFTVEVKTGDFLLADESDGVRILKWPVDPNASGGDAGNDFAIFRYSHILLAKAEAQVKSGTGDPTALVNQVRTRAGLGALTGVTADDVFNERGYEFLWESMRRQDQIRNGKFLAAWTLKPASDGAHRELFPIPQKQLDTNPNLDQNMGYN